jgi:hypothetical protein
MSTKQFKDLPAQTVASGDTIPMQTLGGTTGRTTAQAIADLGGGGGGETLAQTLAIGSVSGPNDIEIDAGQKLTMGLTAPPSGVASKGHYIVGDGTGGTVSGQPYFVDSAGTLYRLNTSNVQAVEYIEAGFTIDKSIADASIAAVIDVDDNIESNGISLAANVFSLKANRTYRLEAALGLDLIGGGELLITQWYDVTAAAHIGARGVVRGLNYTGTASNSPVATHTFTPTVDTDVELRSVVGGNGAVTIRKSRSWVRITDISSGGGGGDWVAGSLSVNPGVLAVDTRVPFDTEIKAGSDLDLDTTTNIGQVAGLKAGRSYELWANIAIINSNAAQRFKWYDVTAAAYIGTECRVQSTSSTAFSNDTIAHHIYTPGVDTTVELRASVAPFGSPVVDSDSASFRVSEMGGGGGGGGGGDPDFIFASRQAGNQTNFNTNDPIGFDTADHSNTLAVDAAGKFSGFVSGRVYIFEASLRLELNTSGQSVNLQWYDVTGAAYFGPFSTFKPVTAGGAAFTTMSTPRASLTAAVSQEVELRVSFTTSETVNDVTAATCGAFIRSVTS